MILRRALWLWACEARRAVALGGGVSDYAIGIWGAEFDKVFEKMRYVRG